MANFYWNADEEKIYSKEEAVQYVEDIEEYLFQNYIDDNYSASHVLDEIPGYDCVEDYIQLLREKFITVVLSELDNHVYDYMVPIAGCIGCHIHED